MTGTPEPLYNFPMPYSLKAVGLDDDDFQGLVMALVRKHVPDLAESAVSHRASQGGKYLSVTVRFVAESKGQIEAIFQELSGHERVLMVL